MSFVQDMLDKFIRRKRKHKRTPKRGLQKQPTRKVETKQPGWADTLVPAPAPPSKTALERKRRMFWKPFSDISASMRNGIGSTRLLSGLLLLMCIVTLYKAGTNPRFLLDDISITGVEFLPSDAVVEASGLRDNHIFSAEPEIALQNIERLPGVTEAELRMQWPDKVTIYIEEDTPVLIWEEAGQPYWVNGSGEIVPIVDAEFDLLRVVANVPPAPAPTPLPTPNPEASPDDVAVEVLPDRPNTYLRFVPEDVMFGALSLQQEISRTQGVQLDILAYDIHGGLSYVDTGGWKAWAGPSGDVPLTVPGGWRVFLGADNDMAMKVATYNAVVANLLDRGVVPEYVNVSRIDRPFYKPVFVPEQAEVPTEIEG